MGEARAPVDDSHNGKDTSQDVVQLDYAVQQVIGAALRDYCNDIIQEPVPQKFVALLARLEAEERNKRNDK